jgi:DNA-binding transcriptional LysR family regulator
MLDWDDLRSFLAISRHRTLSGAARALGVQQSTMSRRLAALERRGAVRLLHKTPDGYVLTEAGEAVLGNAERMEAEALAVERAVTGHDVRLEGSIRLTTVETLASEILLPGLAGFCARYPGIRLELIADTRSLSLTKREADIALRLARPSQAELAVRKLGAMEYGLYASSEYLAMRGTPDLAAGAPGHRVVLNDQDLIDLPEMVWLRAMTARAEPALMSNSRFAHRAAAESGLGLAALARYLGDNRPGLQRLTPPTPSPVRDLWLSVHSDIRHMPRIRALTDFLSVLLRQEAGRLHPSDEDE